jgi:hypothetical protein
MKGLTLFVLCHLILVPLAVPIIANDMAHPERWDSWYRNPALSIPYCIALDAFIGGMLVYLWWKERRREKGLWLLKVALRLQSEGKYTAAEAAYRQGRRLTGIKPD